MTSWGRFWPGMVALVAFFVVPWTEMEANDRTDEVVDRHHEADSMPRRGAKEQESAEKSGVLGKPLRAGAVTLLFGGFAKVDFIQDFDPIGNVDQFKVNTIPVDGTPDAALGGNTNISARQTRLSLDVRGDTANGRVRGYVEGDFFGEGNAFRIRHGYGEWNGWLGGQTWSTFQDISARPFTIDYEGPDTEVFVRQAMIRYTGTPSERFEWSIAVEDPDSQVSAPAAVPGVGRSEFPDVPFRVRFKPEWGHIQVAAILRQLRFVSDDGTVDESVTGYGVNVSGKAGVLKRDAISGNVAIGSGIGRYVESFGGTGSDAALTPAGDLETIDVLAVVLGYTHHWSDRFHSTLSGGFADLEDDVVQPDDAIRFSRSAHLNLVYAPNHLVNIGGELMWGLRENRDGADGDALRFQLSLQYKFR